VQPDVPDYMQKRGPKLRQNQIVRSFFFERASVTEADFAGIDFHVFRMLEMNQWNWQFRRKTTDFELVGTSTQVQFKDFVFS
jgi:hypothetical protein